MESVIDYSVLNSEEVSIFTLDNVNSVVLTENDEYRNSLRNYFTDEVKNARFFPSVKAGNWDGKIRHLMTDGTLPSGLLDELFELLNDWDIPYKTYNSDSKPNLDLSSFESIIKSELIDKQETPMNPWDHQINIAKTLLSDYKGLAKSATSSGKTYTMAMICKFLQYTGESNKTLIIVPRTDLVVQFSRDALSYGFDDSDIGMFFGVIKDSNKPITIATWQSIQNIEKNDPFFEKFECVIADEVHLVNQNSKTKSGSKKGGNVFKRCIDNCINAKYRYGLTGTLPTDRLSQRTIKGCLGGLKIEVNAKDLMEKKHITDLSVILTMISYSNMKEVRTKIKEYVSEQPEDSITKEYIAERKFIESYSNRYRLITKIVNKCQKSNENVLVLANTIDYGKKLKTAIEYKCKNCSKVFHIHGEMPVKERQNIILEAENMENVVIVATTSLFSTGISIKRLHSVILGAGATGKSKISLLQSVGRALRQHNTKRKAKVFDLIDVGLKYSESHGSSRVEYYDSEKFETKIYETTI